MSNIDLKDIIFFGNKKFVEKENNCFKFRTIYNYSDKNIFSKFVSYLISQIKLYFIFLLDKPEIIHFQWFKIPTFDYIFLKLLKLSFPKASIIYTAHNLLPHDTGGEYKNIFSSIYNLLDGIIVHENSIKNKLIKKFNVDKNKVITIPHGILKFDFSNENVNSIISKMKHEKQLENKIVFSFLGNIRKNKGIELLLNVWSENKKIYDNKDIVLLIAGSCDDKRIKEKLLNSSVDKNIILDINFLPLENFIAYLKITDVLLLPYRNISQSGLLLTAISENIPVLVTNKGGLIEPFRIGKIGWIIDYNEISLKNELKQIINNSEEIYSIKTNKKLWNEVEEFYSWGKIGKKTKEFYKTIYKSDY